MGPRLEVEVAADSRARRWIDLDRIGDGVVLSSSSSAVCRGVDQAVHFGGYGYPPWLYFEIRRQKWFTVEAVAVLVVRGPWWGGVVRTLCCSFVCPPLFAWLSRYRM